MTLENDTESCFTGDVSMQQVSTATTILGYDIFYYFHIYRDLVKLYNQYDL